ncbi:MAG: dual specificity protein phosphatase family protein [Gammaproteobacteria bacterium]|nr:dual specificity protein phosphatase family protein [Gammaproteobacteria bacterium]NNJ72719.1 hypothetical protein [Enterobacterales bacterium]
MINSKNTLNPIYLLGGAIAIGPRLKVKLLDDIRAQGVTHVVTLLSEKEGAQDIQQAVTAHDLNWLWLSLENAKPPAKERYAEIEAFFNTLKSHLTNGAYLYFHCAAGIHRTGMITYAFLRYLNNTPVQAFERLKELRELSSQEVGRERLQWGNTFAPKPPSKLIPGKITLEEFLQHDFSGAICYAHSVGEGYQYRGKIDQISTDGSMRLVDVEMTSNLECDFDFTYPYLIDGEWLPSENIDYSSTNISIEVTERGLEVTYAYAGTVYIHHKISA